jgi:hypothetical protein
MKKVLRILLPAVAALAVTAFPVGAQTTAEKMKAKVDSLREASRSRPGNGGLKSIDPKMDAIMDSLLAIKVDSSIFRGSKVSITAIDIEDHIRQGWLYTEEYDFEEAQNSYEKALSLCTDSVRRAAIQAELTRCGNALAMMDYCATPKVVARQKFPLEEFFLYYPLRDRSWRACPNVLDKDGGKFARALYMPDFTREVVFSATGEDGSRDLFSSRKKDAFWTRPSRLPAAFSSSEDEIYPTVCGNQLFFASKGLYGMGGYDIYVSNRDPETGEWGVPENMGFPYNSPFDDFLFINTEDGKYSLFASNRECSRDSVYIYVLEYEQLPVRKVVGSASDLWRLCALRPSLNLKKVDNSDAMSLGQADENTRLYMEKIANVRALRDTIAQHNRELDALRARYSASMDWQRVNLAEEIRQQEARLPALQQKLDAAGRELQKTEMEFLMKGVVIDARKAVSESDNTVVGVGQSYAFARKNPGDPLRIELEPVPVPELPVLEIPEIEEL